MSSSGEASITEVNAIVYNNFVNSIKSEVTKHAYNYLLRRYMKFLNYGQDRIDMLMQQPKVVESNIIRYIIWLKQEQKLSAITINQYIAAIFHFYAMNDIRLNRKKIAMYIGDYVRTNKDRAYTYEEIKKLMEFCDERLHALILLLASSGTRIGAVPDLCLSHLKKISQYQVYQITLYYGTKNEYFTFTTPECAKAIDTYLEFRVRTGEKLTDDSPLFRKQYDTEDYGKIRKPKCLTTNALTKLLEDKLLKAGIVTKTHQTESTKPGQKRNPVARAHGFRKFVETNMIRAKLQPEIREMLLGHDLPSNVKTYYRPDESEFLEEYLKAVDLLTINEENRLRREVETLKVEKTQVDRLAKSLQSLRDRLNLPDE